MRVAVRVRDGLPWVASNADLTIPTAFGTAPGHGVLVGVLRDFSGVEPVVAGKPERPLLDETIRRVGGERPLMVGDRLDTDIDGALNVGCDSLLVMTGVTGLAELVAVPAGHRPTYVAAGLGGLLEAHRAPEVGDAGAPAGWLARARRRRVAWWSTARAARTTGGGSRRRPRGPTSTSPATSWTRLASSRRARDRRRPTGSLRP